MAVMDEREKEKLLQQLEGMGETRVREYLEAKMWVPGTHKEAAEATAWLQGKENQRTEAHRKTEASQADKLVEQAKKANRIAKEANRVAVAAFILAAVALALSLGLFF